MRLGFRIARGVLYFVLGLLALSLGGKIDGLSIYFGMAAITAAALTLVYLFLHFDEDMPRETVLELLMDGFGGLIIFTYPYSNNQFFIFVFSIWIATMGSLVLTSGLFSRYNKENMWLYILFGISFIVSGFSILHVPMEESSLATYFISFVLIIYGALQLWELLKNKKDIY